MKCPECDSTEVIQNGKRKGANKEPIQRYFCKNCKKSFSEHMESYTKTEKRLLSMLIYFLENASENISLKDLLEKSKKYKSGISDISIKKCKETKPFYRTEYALDCEKPRLIICEHKNKITLIKIPSQITNVRKNKLTFIVD